VLVAHFVKFIYKSIVFADSTRDIILQLLIVTLCILSMSALHGGKWFNASTGSGQW